MPLYFLFTMMQKVKKKKKRKQDHKLKSRRWVAQRRDRNVVRKFFDSTSWKLGSSNRASGCSRSANEKCDKLEVDSVSFPLVNTFTLWVLFKPHRMLLPLWLDAEHADRVFLCTCLLIAFFSLLLFSYQRVKTASNHKHRNVTLCTIGWTTYNSWLAFWQSF